MLGKKTDEKQIERISYYEELLDRAAGIVKAEEKRISAFSELQDAVQRLEAYYTGPLWKKDFADDEEGRLPAGLKRGVLSEDGIDSLLEESGEWSDEVVEMLLAKPYSIIDILPFRVPEESGGRYFGINGYFLEEDNIAGIRRRFADLLLKLNCYCGISVNSMGDRNWVNDPEPRVFSEWISEGLGSGGANMLIAEEETLISLNSDDTYMTVYNGSEKLLGLISLLASAEGLFLWRPEQ